MAAKDIIKHQFQKGQSGNPKGRPRKLYKHHIADLKQLGYQAPTHTEYYELIGILLSMTEEDLKNFAADKTRPYWVRVIITDLNSKRTRQKLQADYRDWLFGKAKQQVDLTSNNKEIPILNFYPVGGNNNEQ